MGGEDVVVVYVTTPLGSGTAQISLPVVRHFLQVCPPVPHYMPDISARLNLWTMAGGSC